MTSSTSRMEHNPTSTQIMSIKVLYMNTAGLTAPKLLCASKLFDTYHIIIFAETWHTRQTTSHPYLIAHSPNNSPRSVGHQNGGIAILSKYPNSITITHNTEYSISFKFDGINFAAIYLPPKLSTSNVDRILSATPKPQILIGDVNVRYGSINGDTISTCPGRRETIARHCNTWDIHWQRNSNHNQVSRTDHLYKDSNIRSTWELSPDKFGIRSDHHPMLITIEPPNPTMHIRRELRRFQLKHLDDPLVTLITRRIYNNYDENSIDDLSIDTFYDSIALSIHNTAEKVLTSYVPSEARQRSDPILHQLQTSTTSMPDSIRLFKRLQRSMAHRNRINPSNGSMSVETEVEHYFKSMYQTLPKKLLATRRSPFFPSSPIGINDECFSPESICLFFRQYPGTKSCGRDGFHTRLLQTLCENELDPLPCRLSTLFQRCLREGLTPRNWNQSVVNPLPKKANSSTIDDFRPVSLTPMIRRCFESIFLQNSLTSPTIGPRLKLNDNQAGFRSSQSCLQHLLVADDFQIRHRGPQIFIDLKSAYDRVDIDILLEQLRNRHLPIRWTNIIASLYTGCSTQVVVNGSLTETIDLHTGLFQGSLLAPLLWNIYIDPLADSLNSNDRDTDHPRALFYADDIRLQYYRPTTTIQNDLDTISRWASASNMIPSISKSAVIWADKPPDLPLKLSGNDLPMVRSYQYLGMEITCNGIDFPAYIDRCVSKATGLLHWLRTQINSDAWKESIRVAIVKAFIRPCIEYGMPLTSLWLKSLRPLRLTQTRNELEDSIQTLYKECLKWIFKTTNSSKNLLSIAGLPTLEHRRLMLEATFTQHIKNAPQSSAISRLIRKCQRSPPSSPRILIDYISTSALFTEWKLTASDNFSPPKTLRQHINAWIFEKFNKDTGSYGRNSTYIAKRGRTSGGMDRILDITDSRLRHFAIKWRLGRLAYMLRCSCGSGFTRQHLNCLPAKFSSNMRTELIRTTQNIPLYCPIDDSLNSQSLVLFEGFLDFLKPTWRIST